MFRMSLRYYLKRKKPLCVAGRSGRSVRHMQGTVIKMLKFLTHRGRKLIIHIRSSKIYVDLTIIIPSPLSIPHILCGHEECGTGTRIYITL